MHHLTPRSDRLLAAAAAVLLTAPAVLAAPQDLPSCCSEPHAVLAPLPASATDKERWLRRLIDAPHDRNIFLSTGHLDAWREQLAELPADAPLTQRFGVRWSLSLGLVYTGELDEAIRLCEECLQLCREHPDETRSWLPDVLFRLAAAHFRLAERQNCIARHNAESCILPLSAAAVHQETRGAEAARDVLVELLRTPGSDLRLEATWLLNIAHMALGTWPDGVPAEHRIAPSVFAGEAPLPRFRERARELGLAAHTRAGCVAVDDFTGDGRLDVLTCAMDLDAPLRLCRNDGDGGFTEIGAEAGLGNQLGGSALVQADVDNDGLLDVLVLRGGGMFAGCEFPCSLLRQDRPGHFVDVTAAAGIELGAPSRSAAFADVDRDGDLDLFVGYETERAATGLRFPSKLYRNDGAGRFEDVTAASGIDNPDRLMAAVFGDIDNDGDPDLFVSNHMAKNRLYVNRGDGTFAEAAAARGVDAPDSSGPAGFFDCDNDGDLDLLVTYQHHYRQIRSVAAFYLDGAVEDEAQRLFENDGTGTFRDVAAARGMRRVLMATGLNFGDVDADGWPDAYVATGAHDLAALFPNALLLGGARFRDATFPAGLGHLQKGNGVAMADLDDDGDLDLLCQVGGYHPDDAFGDVCFENPGHGNRWLAVELRGARDNWFGVGARLRARVRATDGAARDVWAAIGPGASLGCNPLRAFLGLGDAAAVEFVEVHWPAQGAVQRVVDVPMDAGVLIAQGQDRCWPRPRAALRLGARR
ncbi:MAG: CRTAC1 family protein [Planctomycetota bacterium]